MKNLKNLGKTLNRNEQQLINGGLGPISTCGGCSNLYVCPDPSSNVCAFIDTFGSVCQGTYSNQGPCCA